MLGISHSVFFPKPSQEYLEKRNSNRLHHLSKFPRLYESGENKFEIFLLGLLFLLPMNWLDLGEVVAKRSKTCCLNE